MLWTSLWRHGHLCVCMRVCFWDKKGFVRKDKGFHSACMPVCVVLCRINRQQLWFILYSQYRGPLYLTGKVKAYSLEAVLQRSTCSLGMRNRTIERKTVKKCTPLLSSGCVLPLMSWKHTLYCWQLRASSIYPLVFSILSPLSSSYHHPPVIYLQYHMP